MADFSDLYFIRNSPEFKKKKNLKSDYFKFSSDFAFG